MKTAIVYWSGTGNTEMMAKEIETGMKEAGADVELFEAAEFSAEKLELYDAVAFGCPSMGDEELEESEFAPMFLDCEKKLSGKRIGLFGSYGWGDGEWMRNWEDRCRQADAHLAGEGVICMEEPDQDAKDACRALGRILAQ